MSVMSVESIDLRCRLCHKILLVLFNLVEIGIQINVFRLPDLGLANILVAKVQNGSDSNHHVSDFH